MKHHTKDKGDLAVLKAQVDLAEKGYGIAIPLTEHSPFDLLIYKNRKFLTVQVKYRSAKSGALTVFMRSCWADKNGTHVSPVNKDEIDLYCVFCPETNKCYYFDPKTIKKSISIRVSTPKNNQLHSINKAEDFINIPQHLSPL